MLEVKFTQIDKKPKMAMSEAQLCAADRMARGEEAYQGKLLEPDNQMERWGQF